MYDQLLKWKAAILHMLWPEDIEALPRWEALLTRMLQVSYAVVRDFLEGQLTLRAMSLVYTTLLSLVPLLALTFSVLKGFGVQNQLEPALINTLSALGDKGTEIAKQIVSFVDNIKVGVLGSLGLGMLVYTVISLLHKVEKSFNYIWRIEYARPLGQRFSEYLSVVLVGPLLIFSALGVTASLMSSAVVRKLSTMPGLGFVVHSIGTLIPYVLVIVAFAFVYVFMPNTRVKMGPALIGAVVAGVAWETAGWAFGTFVVNSGNYTAIYSGFAILIMFMIWLFVSWLILLLGTSIAFYCQHPEYLAGDKEQQVLSAEMTEKLSMLAMLFIGRYYYRDQAEWHIEELAHWLGVPLNIADAILDRLHANKLLLHTDEVSPPYAPSRDMETIQVKQILDVVRSDDERTDAIPWKLPKEGAVNQMLQAVDMAVEQALQHKTLKDLVISGMGGDRIQKASSKQADEP